MWCLPARADPAFVAAMEDVPDVYERPYDPSFPVGCVEEASKQLVGEVRAPLPTVPGHVAKADAEYVRNGTANLFMATEPLDGWRHVEVTERRTWADFAHLIRDRVDGRYRCATKVVLVVDNLNTHSVASLYEAFAPAEAKRIADKLEIPDRPLLAAEVAAWELDRNESARGVDWRFTTANAGLKLKRLSPVHG